MNKRNVFIVEDEALIANDIKRKLLKLDYEVAGIADSRDTVMKALEGNPDIDLILMDIMIKGDKDGIQTAYEIKEKYDIPVVYLTAYSDENTLKRAEISDPYGYVLKPLQEKEFVTALEIAFYKHQLQKKSAEEKELIYSILDSCNDGIVAVGNDNKIKYLNSQAKFITGWPSEDAVGKEMQEVVQIKNPQNPADAILVNKKQKEIGVKYKMAPLLNRKGEKTGSVFFISPKNA